jgi:hypothetical protein
MHSVAELDELRATVEQMRAELAALHANGGRLTRSWRRRTGMVGTVLCAALFVVGVAGASPTTSTTNVTFLPLTVPHKVLSGVTIAATKNTSAVVIGASTTVPSNATTVQLTVSGKSTTGAHLNFYPAGNPSGASGQTLTVPAGSIVATTTIQENVGESGKVTFANSGPGSATTVTATITGYSTQVTAGDINGVGGSSGQVLTNDGAGGAVWQTPNFQSTDTATVTVHPGADAATNGANLVSAVSAVPAGKLTLIRLEAGDYNLGGTKINLPGNVWIQGAGQSLTTISGTGSPLLNMTGNSGLDLLSVSGGGFECVGVTSTGTVTMQLVNVGGCANGVQNDGSGTVSIVDAVVNSANGHGLEVNAGTATVAGSTIVDTGGVGSGILVSGGATATVSASTVTGAVFSFLVNGTANVADTQLLKIVTGTPHCVGDYNASFVALSSTCT